MKKKGSKELHDIIVSDTLRLLGNEAFHLGRFFANPTGRAYRDREWGREWISYGVHGSPDIFGILLGGRYIGIEVKSGAARQQDNQRLFEAMVKKFGGIYVVVRSPDEALNAVIKSFK